MIATSNLVADEHHPVPDRDVTGNPPPEQPADVIAAVARILDSAPSPELRGLPSEIIEIARLRSACRRIIEGNLPPHIEDELLGRLGRLAARAALPLWAVDAIAAELQEPDPPDVPPLSRELAGSRLRRMGHDECPVCLARVPSEAEQAQWQRRRRWAAQDAEARRRAAPFSEVGS